MPDYINSRDYDDAETLFLSKGRNYNNTIARISVYEEGTITGSREGKSYADIRKNAFDTGFHNIVFRNSNDLTLPVTGYVNQKDYAANNTEIPVIVTMLDNVIFSPSASYLASVATIRWKTQGQHVGWEAGCPDPLPTDIRTYPSDYRFQDMLGNPTNSFQDIGKTWAVPGLEETKQIYPDCDDMVEEYAYSLSSGFGYTVEQLGLVGVTPSGFHFNSEDYNSAYNDLDIGVRSQYDSDPRYNQEYRNRTIQWEIGRGASICYKSRLTRLESLTSPWANSQLCVPGYGYNNYPLIMKYMTDTGSPLLYYKGRLKAGMTPYICISTQYDANDGFANMGYFAFIHGMDGYHIFTTWTCHSFYIPGDTGFVTGMVPMTIAQHVAFIKAAYAIGSIHVLMEFGYNSYIYPYWTGPVAIDEMQEYSEYIENGTNYLIHPSMSRSYHYHRSGTLTSIPNYYTIWYGKDSSGNDINANTWICCRMLDKSMMFYGATTDGEERTVNVVAPTGRSVSIVATPFGEITII